MKVVIFGGRGYLGHRFLSAYPDALTPDVDIADQRAIGSVLDEEEPNVVINAAGKTGRPNIDWCEIHKAETLYANVTGPLILLEECAKRNIYWVHLSSGCIYQGTGPGDPPSRREGVGGRGSVQGFSEEDPPNFFGSFYSQTKAWAESVLREFSNILILRLRMPFDNIVNDRNLIVKLTKYARVLNVQNSLTYIPDLIDAAKILVDRKKTGIYNAVNPGTMSPYEIMQLYKKLVQNEHEFERLTLNDLSEVVRAGRSNCILSTAKLESEGIHLPDVRDRMEEAMREVGNLPPAPSPLRQGYEGQGLRRAGKSHSSRRRPGPKREISNTSNVV